MSMETRPAKGISLPVPAVVIVMGVSGCGKSTIGALLAARLRWEFEDAAKPSAAGRYVIANLDGQEAGAIAGPEHGVPAWNTYVSVEDADAAARRNQRV